MGSCKQENYLIIRIFQEIKSSSLLYSMKFFSLILFAPIVFTMACSSSVQRQKSPFTVVQSEQGIELSENGRPVFAYQKKPKTLTGQLAWELIAEARAVIVVLPRGNQTMFDVA